jgi:chymotrypsin
MKTIQILVALSVAVALTWGAPANDDIDWSSILPIEETPEFLARYPIYKTLFPESLGSESRIVGGNEAARNGLPYQVAMLLTVSGGQALCGGSIISNNYVLTAAHCTDA